MALFKNLYLDFGFLNPFKGKKKTVQQKVFYNAEAQPIQSFSSSKKFRELPTISKRLIDDKEEAKAEIKAAAELPKIKKEVSPPPTFTENKEVKPFNPNIVVNQDLKKSFFKSLAGHLEKEESFMHSNLPKEVIEKNLFEEMQGFWQGRKDEVNNVLYNKAVKTELMKKIEELQQMEIEWQKLQLQHEKLKDELSSKELLIDHNVKHLRRAFKKLHLSSHVRDEHYFVLPDGKKLRNLGELEEQLRNMDDATFNSHVNTNKNDFANWVNDVMGLKELSYNMRKTQTKEQMSDLIANWHNS